MDNDNGHDRPQVGCLESEEMSITAASNPDVSAHVAWPSPLHLAMLDVLLEYATDLFENGTKASIWELYGELRNEAHFDDFRYDLKLGEEQWLRAGKTLPRSRPIDMDAFLQDIYLSDSEVESEEPNEGNDEDEGEDDDMET